VNQGMSNVQLCLAIGLPIIANAAMIGLLLMHMNARFDAVNQRLNDLRDLWSTELHRVEEVLDARLKHLEER